MEPPVLVGLVAVGLGLATGAVFALQWLGRMPRGRDPDALLARGYLLLPVSVAFMLIGLLFLLEGVGVTAVRRVAGPVFAAALLLGLTGMALWVMQPRRLRPAWQRRQVEARRRGATAGPGRYAIELVVDGEPLPEPERFPTAAQAADAARRRLADAPPGTHALVVDTEDPGTAVEVVEPPGSGLSDRR